MTREEREQAIWHDAYMLAMSQDPLPIKASNWADAAVAEFRKRYPPQPAAPPAVWYDEPPFPKDGTEHYCWVEGFAALQEVYWLDLHGEWRFFERVSDAQPLNRRRVCPITKPQEPTS